MILCIVIDILNMCVKNMYAEKNISDKKTALRTVNQWIRYAHIQYIFNAAV